MKTLVTFLMMIIMVVMPVSWIYGQETDVSKTDQRSVVTKHDGSQFIGVILKSDEREVLIETQNMGRIIIPKHEIESIKPVKGSDLVKGEFLGENRFATRQFLTTNALPIKKGESYAMLSIYGPEIHFAAADRLSLGIMTSWGFIPIIGSLKYSTSINESISVGFGVLLGVSPYSNISGAGALGYGILTFGNRVSNFTISAGYAGVTTLDSEKNGGSAPLLSIAAMTKAGQNLSLVLDSFIYLDEGSKFALIMPGVRFSGSVKSAFQIGAGMLVVNNEFFPLPVPVLTWFRAIN